MKIQACFLNKPQHTKLILFFHVSFSGKRKRTKKSQQPLLAPITLSCKTEKAISVAIRGHTASAASTQPSKFVTGMRSASCFPSETVQCLCTEESAGGFLLHFTNFSAGFSLPTLPLTFACRTVWLNVSISGHSFNESVISLSHPWSTEHCFGECTVSCEQKRAGTCKNALDDIDLSEFIRGETSAALLQLVPGLILLKRF